eukprot:TRINITY_DN14021_c0_g1_i5.p1 TRINITY_DN14021_c0_g1~~TRINITY_DN14021_c0_g1_i5.p1  ORF type:complete len:183 (+),score=20.28 TRINITY_DN14021_c0_g1_i5:48-551(+)
MDGKFTLNELFEFAEFCDSRRRKYQTHEFLTQIKGYCTLQLWHHAITHGMVEIEEWLMRLLCENAPLVRFPAHENVAYISRDSTLPIYRVLRIDRAFSLSFQDFFDLMQNAAEESELLDLLDESFDDVVPEPILRVFLKYVILGFVNMMEDVGMSSALLDPHSLGML